jgi:O-antigen/teichoic acid export membrane protein
MKQKNPILNAILYIINSILVKAFQFFLVPVYTAYLTTEQYGVSNLITSFTLIGGVLITLSIGTATSR